MTDWETVVGGAQQPDATSQPVTRVRKGGKASSVNPANDPDKLLFDARDILAGYLLLDAHPWSKAIGDNPSIKSFMQKFAPYLLIFKPTTQQRHSPIIVSATNAVDPSLLEKLLTDVSGGYHQQTDLKSLKKYSEIFPEYSIIEDLVIGKTGDFRNPLGMVMMMTPSKRPIMAMATSRFLAKTLPTGTNMPDTATRSAYIPDFETLMETAKEYECKNLKECVIEFNEITSKFT